MERTTRADQRAATSQRIFETAQRLFAAGGYDRTSVRAIAAGAQVDPSLVMQYFGSKADLFAQVVATRWPLAPMKRAHTTPDTVVDHVMAAFLATATDEGGQAIAALLRSSLTHPEAATTTRKVLFDSTALRVLVPVMSGPERELRAALIASMLLGVHVARTMLGVEVLTKATTEQLRVRLKGAVKTLVEPPPQSTARRPKAKR
jgi:AcrR family transcriptional regulator